MHTCHESKNRRLLRRQLIYCSISVAASRRLRALVRLLVAVVLVRNIGLSDYPVVRHVLSFPLQILGDTSAYIYLFSNSRLTFFVWLVLSFGLHRRGSTENFSRKDRLYSTLPAGSVGRGVRSVTNLARNEESNDWSDDDAVALNGDWVNCVCHLQNLSDYIQQNLVGNS